MSTWNFGFLLTSSAPDAHDTCPTGSDPISFTIEVSVLQLSGSNR